MTTETMMSDEQLIRQATAALIDNLGIMEATRFLTIQRHDRLESVERHTLWQSGLDRDKFFDEFFSRESGK
jgi:hypothetical protein